MNKGLRASSPSEELNQPRRSLNEQNEAILKAMLGKETFNILRDECLHETSSDGIPVYGRCDILRFPFCTGENPNICFNRINRQDSFWPDKHPKYYIEYNRVLCVPDRIGNVDFTCSSCSPGRWCEPEGRCILDEKMYDCWAAEDAPAEQDEVAPMEARASNWVGAEADEDDDVGE